MTQAQETTLPAIEWMTVAEVARYFRLSKMTVYRWINTEKLPVTRVSRSFRIDPKDVEALMGRNAAKEGE